MWWYTVGVRGRGRGYFTEEHRPDSVRGGLRLERAPPEEALVVQRDRRNHLRRRERERETYGEVDREREGNIMERDKRTLNSDLLSVFDNVITISFLKACHPSRTQTRARSHVTLLQLTFYPFS